jgi:hypothetical protein
MAGPDLGSRLGFLRENDPEHAARRRGR